MTRLVKCDNCGATDDWDMGKPFFPDGAVLQIRDDNGSENFIIEVEVCVKCKDELLNAFPFLKKCIAEL
jgi:hypothetical protein